MGQFETGRLMGSFATAKERRSTTAAAPAPNRAHCHVAKVGRRLSLSSQICPGEHRF